MNALQWSISSSSEWPGSTPAFLAEPKNCPIINILDISPVAIARSRVYQLHHFIVAWLLNGDNLAVNKPWDYLVTWCGMWGSCEGPFVVIDALWGWQINGEVLISIHCRIEIPVVKWIWKISCLHLKQNSKDSQRWWIPQLLMNYVQLKAMVLTVNCMFRLPVEMKLLGPKYTRCHLGPIQLYGWQSKVSKQIVRCWRTLGVGFIQGKYLDWSCFRTALNPRGDDIDGGLSWARGACSRPILLVWIIIGSKS